MALTDKHETFCMEYIVDLNATQAAIRSGYSEKTARAQGSRLLTNADIRARIEELQGERAEKLNITAEWVLTKLTEVVSKSMQEVEVEKWDYSEKKLVGTGEFVYDSQGANRALELIGKHLGMFKDKVEHSGSIGVQIVDDIK